MRRKITTLAVTVKHLPVCVAFLIAFGVSAVARAEQAITGTYSDFAYNREGGDLNGTEIHIVMTRRGLKGTVQIAEGGPGDVTVVDIVAADNRIHFDMPARSEYEGHFDGIVTKQALKGTFVYKGGAKEVVSLPRKPSYWDR
jgi:hypothetical protein